MKRLIKLVAISFSMFSSITFADCGVSPSITPLARVALKGNAAATTSEYLCQPYIGNGTGLYAHAGVDLRAAVGTPVYAIKGGNVVAVDGNGVVTGNNGSGLGKVSVRLADGKLVNYLHLSNISVAKGDIRVGDQIGLSGSTGASGPHLHIEVRTSDYNGTSAIGGASCGGTCSVEDIKLKTVDPATVVTLGEVDSLLNASYETSWAYFMDSSKSKWYISNAAGVTYALGRNSKGHAAWVSIGDGAQVANLDFVNKQVSVNSHTYTSPQTYNTQSLVGGEGAEWMYGDEASQRARLIEGSTVPMAWYFFQVESTGKWYIIQIDGTNSTILRLNLTPDKSNYDWKNPLDAAGNEVDTSKWKKEFYQGQNGKWRVRVTNQETVTTTF